MSAMLKLFFVWFGLNALIAFMRTLIGNSSGFTAIVLSFLTELALTFLLTAMQYAIIINLILYFLEWK